MYRAGDVSPLSRTQAKKAKETQGTNVPRSEEREARIILMKRFKRRGGFTLVEMLVVVVVIGLLAALSLGVVVATMGRAQQQASEGLIQMLRDALEERLESFGATQQFSPTGDMNDLGGATGGALTDTGEIPDVIIKRSRLLAKLHTMRGDFPQQFLDFMRAPKVTVPTNNGDRDLMFPSVTGLAFARQQEPAARQYLPRILTPNGRRMELSTRQRQSLSGVGSVSIRSGD